MYLWGYQEVFFLDAPSGIEKGLGSKQLARRLLLPHPRPNIQGERWKCFSPLIQADCGDRASS